MCNNLKNETMKWYFNNNDTDDYNNDYAYNTDSDECNNDYNETSTDNSSV